MKTTGKLIIFIFILLALVASACAADDSPLFEAVKNGDKAAVEALLAKGADVNAKDKDGCTPLHWAASQGNSNVIKLLLAKGADVNAKDKDGRTPLHWAASPFQANLNIIELLLAKGADVNAKNADGITPLYRVVFFGKKDTVELLLSKGADANIRDEKGDTLLHTAVMQGHKDIAELLLAKGADVNAKDKNGSTPLYRAFSREDGIVELLLSKGADVNAKNNSGGTPLHTAALVGSKDTAELLLSKGADINAGGKEESTPLHWAVDAGNYKVAELLENRILKQTKNPHELFEQLFKQLNDKPHKSTRRLIIKLASELKPAPAIPEEARKYFVEGTAIVKAAKNPAQQAIAAQSFTEALKIAPWWGDAYYNLGVAQELAEKYDEAEQAFNFYLLSNPSETEKREVQDRIYGLSAKRKLAGAK
jgi:ankyrin repeat protein